MGLPPLGDQWLDIRRGAGFHTGFAEVAAVGQQRFGLAQLIRLMYERFWTLPLPGVVRG